MVPICLPDLRSLGFFILNWRIIALQCCADFCHTKTGISCKYTYIPSLLNLSPTSLPVPPFWVITEHLAELSMAIQQLPASQLFYPWSCTCVVMYTCQWRSLNSSHPLLPPLYPQVHSLFLCLYSCPEDRFISTIFLDSTAAAAAKSLQSCPTLCDPIDGSPPGSSVPGILQARVLEQVAISFSLDSTYMC